MKIHASKLFCFLYLALFIFSSIALAGGFTQLPRSMGPFEIGMSKAAFIKLTKTHPEACLSCIENETFATLDTNKLNQLDAGYTGSDGADFLFYNDKLYHIATGTSVKNLFLATQEFERMFGGPGKESTQKNGSSALIWEDTETMISVNYHKDDNEVFSVNYYDWNLKEERDWRASIENQQTTPLK